ncbi:MAG: NosD domain-containing protein [Promethearchaeota archaeon]
MSTLFKKNHQKSMFKMLSLSLLVGIGILLLTPQEWNATKVMTTDISRDKDRDGNLSSYIPTNPRASILHGKIYIDGDDPANDWDTFPNKTGLGIFGDPYIIENLYIDSGGTGTGIYIRDSTVYLEVNNCSITNSGTLDGDAGIKLENCENIEIINCNLYNNGYYGIRIGASSNNTLTGNIVTNNAHSGIRLAFSDNNELNWNDASNDNEDGFRLDFSNNNLLIGNNATNNHELGINLGNSSSNTLIGNNIVNNTYHGINLSSSSNNNTLTGNNASNNGNYGIHIGGSSNNTLTGNNASNNGNNGISLSLSDNNNTLTGNNASNNVNYGIYMYSSSNNTVTGNNASNNGNMGIYMYSSSNNTVTRNNASYNVNNGIYLHSSSNNTVTGNNASYNVNFGISLYLSSNNNTLYGNIILENSHGAAYCYISYNNTWDNGTHGNYWGDYEEFYPSAINNLVLWNTPYRIDAANIDYFPLLNMDGSTGVNSNPVISHPLDMDFIIGSAGNILEWSISDTTIHDSSYTIYQDGRPIEADSWVPRNPISINLDALQSGIYNLTLDAADGFGGNVSDNVKVTVWNELGLITHAPIYIDGDDPSHDWDTFLNKTGTGTFGDPYIIENLEIDAGGTGSSILIRDSTVYLEIINCSLTNSGSSYTDAGIKLENCANIKIIYCTSNDNGLTGIYLVDSSNNTLSGNTAKLNTDDGIRLDSSNNNTLSGNNASNNFRYGIYLQSTSNNTLSGNTVKYNTLSGISMWYSNNYNTLTGNNASYNQDGIFFYFSSYNTVNGNNASFNNQHGIRLESSNNNAIYFNIFVENSNDAAYCLLSSDNFWDNGTHGNWWGDYEEFYPSATNDGTIWNIPYQIDDDNVDNFPLVIPNSSTSPLDTTTNTDTNSDTDTDTSESTDSSDTDIPTNTGGNILGPINPFLAIVGLLILISVSVMAVVRRKKKDGEEGDDYDDEFIDFLPAPPPAKKSKKPSLDLLNEKPYKYDPDEPHL